MTETTRSESRKRSTLTELQIRQIRNFRGRGFTFAQIAGALMLPEGTVKTFCHRHPEQLPLPPTEDTDTCRQCGAPLVHTPGRKKKKFCTGQCRLQWWQEHKSSYSAHPQQPVVCPNCGIKFFGERSGQKFCSHSCYIRHRFYRKDTKA